MTISVRRFDSVVLPAVFKMVQVNHGHVSYPKTESPYVYKNPKYIIPYPRPHFNHLIQIFHPTDADQPHKNLKGAPP